VYHEKRTFSAERRRRRDAYVVFLNIALVCDDDPTTMSSFFVVVFFLVALLIASLLLLFCTRRNGKEDECEDTKHENTTKGRAPTRPPKCVAFAFGADVLVSSSRTQSFSLVSLFRGGGFSTGRDDEKKMVKEALRETVTFWATEAACESMVLYFDIGGRRTDEEKHLLERYVEECFLDGGGNRSSGNSHRARRNVRVKRYSSSSTRTMETVGEYVLGGSSGKENGEEGEENHGLFANGFENNGGRVTRSASSSAARQRRRTSTSTMTEREKTKKNKPMDVIILTPSTGYDILSSFTRSLRKRQMKTDEEKEAFLSSLVSMSSSSSKKDASTRRPPPATVALIERELKINFLKNQLPTPELLVSVSQIFSVGKFPGYLLSKCELAHVESLKRMKDTSTQKKILRDYLRSFQRFGT